MKIITLSDTEWGGKPTEYAAVVENEDSEGLAAYITSALEEKWRYGKDAARAVVHGEFMRILKERGFAWIAERILVELTDVDKFDDESDKKIHAEIVMMGLNSGMVKFSVKYAPAGVDARFVDGVVRDALKFYMM